MNSAVSIKCNYQAMYFSFLKKQKTSHSEVVLRKINANISTWHFSVQIFLHYQFLKVAVFLEITSINWCNTNLEATPQDVDKISQEIMTRKVVAFCHGKIGFDPQVVLHCTVSRQECTVQNKGNGLAKKNTCTKVKVMCGWLVFRISKERHGKNFFFFSSTTKASSSNF